MIVALREALYFNALIVRNLSQTHLFMHFLTLEFPSPLEVMIGL